jgi:ATP-binding cassette subfamily F protein 3
VIHIQDVSKQYGSKTLFENAEAHIGHRSKIALIGPNGAGKSTLIRIILAQESADSGKITRAKHLAIGHLAQEVPKFTGRTVLAEVMRMDGRRDELLKAKAELEESFAGGQSDDAAAEGENLERYGRVLEELDHLDEYRLEARAKEILMGMGFKTKDFERSLTEFSGGWLMRVALSRILLMDPDLLLLDEPTNHLDLESLLWLEEFLKNFQGAMLVISHDTSFLNRLVHEVLEIDQKKLWIYRGNLDSYAEQKSVRLEQLKAQYAGQQAKIKEVEDWVSRFGAKATKARQAQSKLKQLDKIERIELPEERSTVRFRFPPAPHSGREVITATRAGVRFGEKTVFHDLNWTLTRGSRVSVVGVNGAGKTTLLKLLSDAMAPTEGTIKFGHEVKVGYYAQHQAETLDFSKTILQIFEGIAPEMPVSQVRAIAGAFLFTGDAVHKKCGILSGGEKARVALAKLLLSPSNFLILDEPTNHLDMDSKAILLEALQDYQGTLCLVSHDRSFVSPLVDSVLEIQASDDPRKGSKVVQLLGGYEEYLERKVKEAALAVAPKSNAKKEAPAAPVAEATVDRSRPSNNQVRTWERERDRLEIEIATLEKKQSELHNTLADPAVYEDKTKTLGLLAQQRELEKKLGDSLSRWEELCQKLSQLS